MREKGQQREIERCKKRVRKFWSDRESKSEVEVIKRGSKKERPSTRKRY